MQARETKAGELFKEGQQLTVPVWQRPYTWTAEQWTELWNDVERLRDSDDEKATHFLGSVVLRAEKYEGMPGEATRCALVDGQQRVATLTLLLVAIRDQLADRFKDDRDKLTRDLFTNPNLQPTHRRRLLLQESDDAAIAALAEPQEDPAPGPSAIKNCYQFFSEKLSRHPKEALLQLIGLIRTRIDVVWVTLSTSDDAHRVFQTINAGGKALRQVDLVRNFFFLLLADQGEKFFREHWKPLEERLSDTQTERYFSAWTIAHGHTGDTDKLFHYFSKDLEAGSTTRKQVWKYGERLVDESSLFAVILGVAKHKDKEIEFQLELLRGWGTRPTEGLLFLLLRLREEGRLRDQDVSKCVAAVYSFLARRFLAGYEPNLHRSILTQVALKLRDEQQHKNEEMVALLRILLSKGSELKKWPDNDAVMSAVVSTSIYTNARRRWVASVLMLLDQKMYDNPKQAPKLSDYAKLEIEHILPQTLSKDWQSDLRKWGVADPMELSRQRLHVLGNLTLSPINEDLSNLPLATKVSKIQDERLKINANLKSLQSWTEASIDERSRALTKMLLDNLQPPMTDAEIKKSRFASETVPDLSPDEQMAQEFGEE